MPLKSSLTEPEMGNALASPTQITRRVTLLLIVAAFGAVATASTQTSPAKSSAGDDLFTNSGIRRLSIEIAPAGIAELRNYRWRRDASDEDRKDVPATVREGDTVWTNVAVHLKGAA